ncbi:MAG: hypothetical protein KatS3mg080_1062 [Anoxybacillus sp.]|nr:MAG: hypothetical protein KatS3mg080_1062 [Anoxybacillus sp.]
MSFGKGRKQAFFLLGTSVNRTSLAFRGQSIAHFHRREEAEQAFASGPFVNRTKKNTVLATNYVEESICVDAACSGNPGWMEYRGVHTKTGKELFHVGPMIGTNNIGEFLAIVHALAWLQQQNKSLADLF